MPGRGTSLSKYTRSSSPTRRQTSHKKHHPRSKLLTRDTILKCQDYDFEEISTSIKDIESESRDFLKLRKENATQTKSILNLLFSQLRLIFKEETTKLKHKDLKTISDTEPGMLFRSESG